MLVAIDAFCHVLLPDGELVELEDAMRAHVAAAPAPDIEVIGDSVARVGLMSSGLADGTLTAENVSTPASGTPKSFLMLARQFEAGHVPKVLVIAHSPHTFGQVRYEVLVGGFAYWSEIPGLVVDADKWTDVLYGVFTKLSYVLMHRDSFSDLLTKGDPSFFLAKVGRRLPLPDLERIKEFPARLAAGEFPRDRVLEVRERAAMPFTVMPINDKYFRRILQLARTHGVKVFWVTMPSPAHTLKRRSKVHYEEDMLAYLRQFESSGELQILRGEFVAFPDNLFIDSLHLNEAGAVRLACEMQALKPTVLEAAGVPGDGETAGDFESSAFTVELMRHCAIPQPQAH